MGKLLKVMTVALFGAMFLIISTSLFVDLDRTYQSNKSAQFNTYFASLNRTAFDVSGQSQDISREIGDKFANTSTTTETTAPDSIWAGSFAVLKLLFQIPNLLFNLLTGLSTYLQIPTWFTGMVVMIVVVTIVSVGISILLNRKP